MLHVGVVAGGGRRELPGPQGAKNQKMQGGKLWKSWDQMASGGVGTGCEWGKSEVKVKSEQNGTKSEVRAR